MRRQAVWWATAPIALAGVAVAHAASNAVFGSPGDPGAELFASAGTGSRLALPLAALAAAAVLVALLARVAGVWWVAPRSRTVAAPFACVAPLAFVLLELAEVGHDPTAIPWSSLLAPAVLVGLVLQLPFALAGYALARLLLRASDRVRRALRRRPPARRAVTAVSFTVVGAEVQPATALVSRRLGRAPPSLAVL